MADRPASRPEPTLPLSAINLPLLGSRVAPESTFQYLLQQVNPAGATFACPAWLVRREHFQVGDRIEFHFPFRTPDGWHRQRAEVSGVEPDEARTGQLCHAVFRDHQPLHHPVFAVIEQDEIRFRAEDDAPLDPDQLLGSLLRDCMLLKRGIGVYFKHLVPLFSRLTPYSAADYGAVRAMLLEDVRRRIEANIATFAAWHERAETGAWTAANLARELDLEVLRATTEAEIERDLFDVTFDGPATRQYLNAIRLLEQKLRLNYNSLVLLYAQAL